MASPFGRLTLAASIAAVGSVFAASAQAQSQPTLYVHIRIGKDANPGTFPGATGSLQTISRALELATLTPGRRTILIAGAFDAATAAVIPYDNVAGPGAALAECFPLPMLPQVSLMWDTVNSDLNAGTPPQPVRPAIRDSTPIGGATLLRFTNAPPAACAGFGQFGVYAPTGSPVRLRGLDFERGNPAIELLPNVGGPVNPILSDLQIRFGYTAVRAVTATTEISPQISGCTFERVASPALAMIGASPDALVSLSASGPGLIGGSVDGCTIRAIGTPAVDLTTPAGVRFAQSAGTGIIRTTITGCLFNGSTVNGMIYGLDIGFSSIGGANTGNFQSIVTQSTFNECYEGVVALLVPTAGVPGSNPCRLELTGCQFNRSYGTNGGAVVIDMGAAHLLDAVITNCVCYFGAADGIHLRISTPSVGATPGALDLIVEQNEFLENAGDGIELNAQDLTVVAGIRRNGIFKNGGDGIELHAQVGPGNPMNSTLDAVELVNNLVGYNLENGIYNHVTQIGTGTATAMPTVVYNTVYGNTMFGLENSNAGSAALQAFPVYNSIFEANGPSISPTDINVGALPEGTNIFSTRFAGATSTGLPPLQNNNTPNGSNLTDPVNLDFTLSTSSTSMIDRAIDNPPSAPALDFFGNQRVFDNPGFPNIAPFVADRGAHERP